MSAGQATPVAVSRPGAASVLSTNRGLRNTCGLSALIEFGSSND
jgi:hypothetical protein